MTIKYAIVIDYLGNESPIVFGPAITHNTIRGERIISAGYATKAITGLWFVHGKGVSLGVESRPNEDGALLNKFFEHTL